MVQEPRLGAHGEAHAPGRGEPRPHAPTRDVGQPAGGMTGPRTPAAAPHEISWIEDGRVLLLILRGFWDDDASAAFERGVRSALASGAGEAFHAVCDATALTVQRSETQERIQRLLDEMRSAGMVAGGVVVESALLKLQVGRTVDLDRTRFFPDRSKAIAWARQQLPRRAERKPTPERATPVRD